jgi:2'-5' RNA ligase
VRDQAGTYEREGLARLVSSVQVDSSVSMQVHEVSLIRSDLRPGGPVYTHLAALRLTKA